MRPLLLPLPRLRERAGARALPFVVVAALAGCATADQPPALPGRVAAPPPPIMAPGDALLTNTPWAWQLTRTKDGRVVPDAPERYTLTFQPGGTVAVRADCNRGSATYLLNDTALNFGPIAMTKMMCPPGSRDTEFLRELAAVTTQGFEGNDLLLTTRDGGVMRFTTPRQ
jgi:heat shock protein HslJ